MNGNIMNIAMATYTASGGAGRAMLRLMQGLQYFKDVECHLFVYQKSVLKDEVLRQCSMAGKINPFVEYIQKQFFEKNIYPNRVLMSMMYSGMEKSFLEKVKDADIVNFHWIAKFISVEAIKYLSEQGKSLVWTFHDRNPMTGGCHCVYGCNRYQIDCDNCPQLVKNPYNITRDALKIKVKNMPKDLVVIAPSKWMGDCARKSQVFKNHRIEVIPNSVELNVFKNYDKREARRELLMPLDKKIILFGAENHNEIHKGYAKLLAAMKYAVQNTELIDLVEKEGVEIVLFGNPTDDLKQLGIAYRSLGYIINDELLAKVYAAADVLVVPSLEDNLPNMMLESLACGTPVVGFCTGGIPDIVQNGVTGKIASYGDVKALGQAIADTLLGEDLSKTCRSFAERYLSERLQAERYRDLYVDLLSQKHAKSYHAVEPVFKETQKMLAPYLFATNEYFLGLDRMEKIKFLEGSNFERHALVYAVEKGIEFLQYTQASIGIWGTGDIANKFMQLIAKRSPEYLTRIGGFFDNNRSSGSVGGGGEILNVRKIYTYNLKAIIIASFIFENDIYKQIQYLEEKGIKIYRLGKLYCESCLGSFKLD